VNIVFFTLAGIAAVLLIVSVFNRNPEVAASRAKVVGVGVFFTALFFALGLWFG
jgi:hypothetical protein